MSTARVLFFAADPHSAPPNGSNPRLQLDEEMREIRMRVRAADHREHLVFDSRPAARTEDLLQALNETPPQVVHFSGHGGSDGLVLVGKDGKPHPVGADALRRLFTVFRGNIRVVVLNACFSRPQAQAIADVVGCAIGTRGQISDTAAITFGAAFYGALAFGRSVREAYDQAATALALDHVDDRECPELVVGAGVDPSALVLIQPDGGDGPGPATPGPAPIPSRAAPSTPSAASGTVGAGVGLPGPRSATGHADAAAWSSTPRPSNQHGLKRWGGTAAAVLVLGGGGALGLKLLDGRSDDGRPPATNPVEAGSQVVRGPDAVQADSVPSDDVVRTPVPIPQPPVPDTTPPRELASTAADVARARVLYEKRDFDAAFPIFQRAAEAGDAEAMAFLGIMHVSGEGTHQRPDVGVQWLRRSAAAGNARGLNGLGYVHQEGIGGVTRNPDEAMRLYEEAQAKGSAKAMNNIGHLYRKGLGVERNYTLALQWYRKAADAGDPEAMTHVGAMYSDGLGVGADTARAVQWFRNAVDGGSVQAMVNLGRIREHQGDYNEARALYLRAANAGSPAGMNNLGTLYYNGRGFSKDRDEAIRWFRRAAAAGARDAAANLLALGVR